MCVWLDCIDLISISTSKITFELSVLPNESIMFSFVHISCFPKYQWYFIEKVENVIGKIVKKMHFICNDGTVDGIKILVNIHNGNIEKDQLNPFCELSKMLKSVNNICD